jgi:hypothetical protein
MKENLRRSAQEMIRKFKFVLEEVGADPGEDTFWTVGDALTLKTMNQFLDKFSLEDCHALDEVIRTEPLTPRPSWRSQIKSW